jgi:guanylate kinase
MEYGNMNRIVVKSHDKIILVGGGGSGKDYWKKKLVDIGFKADVSYTTREKRQNEEDGVSYNFVTQQEFSDMIKRSEFVQWNMFGNGHFYGTHKGSFSTNQLFIMTPNIIIDKILSGVINEEHVIVYLDVEDHVRKSRMLHRGDDPDEVNRRLSTDSTDFYGFIEKVVKAISIEPNLNHRPRFEVVSNPTGVVLFPQV